MKKRPFEFMAAIQWVATLLLVVTPFQASAETDKTIEAVRNRWAQVTYEVPARKRKQAFAELASWTRLIAADRPESAESWIWEGIVLSSYARQKGGYRALKLDREAKAAFEKALAIDPAALNGLAYTRLGTLYATVPHWPLCFGSDKKAVEYLNKGLALDPDGNDSNFFYAEYLQEKGDYRASRLALQKAFRAMEGSDESIAAEGRHREILSRIQALESLIPTEKAGR